MGTTGADRAPSAPSSVNTMVMRIVTRFGTVEEFVQSFSRFCAESSCFIPGAWAKTVGVETGFSIRLSDGTPMLRGLCVVVASWTNNDNPFHRPGVQLGLRKLTPESKLMFQHLRRVHNLYLDTARVEVPPEVPADQVEEHARVTVQMAPLFPPSRVYEVPETVEGDSGGIPEPIDAPESVANVDITIKSTRPPVMTLLGVAPLEASRRPDASRVAMVALSPELRATPTATPFPRRSLWTLLFGWVGVAFRRARWAYRRRRGVRASVRRLPTSVRD
ncbi:hypothetical protein BH11MYX3_BH11MYX3_10080 [soil metagenome]